MVRSELLQKMRDLYPNILSKDMEKIISIILSEINDALHRGQNFEARGFGSFKNSKTPDFYIFSSTKSID